jgi:ABC-2 type transport system permease protein
MRNFWLVARHEYRRTVGRRAFLLLTLAIPVGLAALIALVVAIETGGKSTLPIGYVDQAGVLEADAQASLPDAEERVPVRAFADEEAARAALEQEEIQAFFVLPPTYPESLATDVYYLEEPPGEAAWEDFDDFVRANLVRPYPEAVQVRLLEGTEVIVRDIASGRAFRSGPELVVPVIGSILFFVATMMASGYMLQVVADEKENRTMEVMLTSVTPGQLILGKAVGLLAAALTQLGIYVVTGVVTVILARPFVPDLAEMTVPWGYLGVMALFFVPAYALIAAIMVALGSAVTEVQQGQQVAGLLNLVFALPLLLVVMILRDPGAPVVVFFSLFPPTAFMTIALRWGLGTVPVWQLGVSWVLLVATAGGVFWLAAKVFRAGMLRYGQPLSLRSAMAAIRGQ